MTDPTKKTRQARAVRPAQAGAKPAIRWDWIETQWQRGTLSNVQIAKQHEDRFQRSVSEAAIRLRVSQNGWQRDLSEAVRRETRAKLAKENLRESATSTANADSSQNNEIAETKPTVEEQIAAEESQYVDIASDALVILEKRQRRRLAESGVTADRMQAYASAALKLEKDGTPTALYEPGELKDVISVAGNAIVATLRVVTAERKLFGMDAPSDVDREIAYLMAKLEARPEEETA